MGHMQIICNHNTKHLNLIDFTENILAVLKPTSSDICEKAGFEAIKVTVRITDEFATEVERNDPLRYPGFTTERAGGEVCAITLSQDDSKINSLILINSVVFSSDTLIGIASLPVTLGHEIAHCIIGQARVQYGVPCGYCPKPVNLIETISYTALSVCDEFLADTLSKALLPPIKLATETNSGEAQISAQILIANNCLNKMHGDLDKHVYPAWRDAVLQYCGKCITLEGMTTSLVTTIQEGLILSAHYRSAVADLGDGLDEIRKIEQHPGMQLYLTPFWNRVGPVMDARIASQPFKQFGEIDQESFDAAYAGIEDIWLSLGITFEMLPSGQVYVHVNEPL